MPKKKKPTNKQKDLLLQSRVRPKKGNKAPFMKNIAVKEPRMRDMLPQFQMETKRRLEEARKEKEAFSHEILEISARPRSLDVAEDITTPLTKPIKFS